MPHHTSIDHNAFVERITFDFIGQLAQRLETSDMSQGELAHKLEVSDSDVSQVLNLNRTNLNLKTMVRYARALGMKIAVVAYDDGDPNNENGPVGSEIFNAAWEKQGKPRDLWAFTTNVSCIAANSRVIQVPWDLTYQSNVTFSSALNKFISASVDAGRNASTFQWLK
jgi:predicted XRE-type DNA-binding protein